MPENTRSFLYDYYACQSSRLREYILLARSRHSLTTIHQLRVTLKRIKAYLTLLSYVYDDFKVKENQVLFKRIFKSAGMIRESQINIRLLRELSGNTDLFTIFSANESRLRRSMRNDLNSALSDFSFEKLDQKDKEIEILFYQLGKARSISNSESFIRFVSAEIINIMKGEDAVVHLHKMRIKLKNIKPVLSATIQAENRSANLVVLENLTATEQYIGKWHDLWILDESLKSKDYIFEGKGRKISGEYSVLTDLLNSNRKELEMEIIRCLGQTLGMLSHYSMK